MRILIINPGSTSTKIAVYEEKQPIFTENVSHDAEKLASYKEIPEQLSFREKLVRETLAAHNVALEQLSAVIGRGGLVPGLKTGGYEVNDKLFSALRSRETPAHASNLGGMLSYQIAKPLKIPAYIYDAVTSSELGPIAQITGFSEITRQSFCHVLNSRATAIKYAMECGKEYESLNLIVAHLGGGISISVHCHGKIIDSLSDDDGQFSPERSGSVALLSLVDLCFSGHYTKDDIKKKIRGRGGMFAHLGTSDCREIERRIAAGDEKAALVFQAQCYQIAKGIGLLSVVLKGKIDAIILTGGLAYSLKLTEMVKEYIAFIAPVKVFPGENEMEALALGALRILHKEERLNKY